MCKALNINYDIFAKRNNKSLLVKKFHRFINKVTATVVEDGRGNDVFAVVSVAAEYAWNSSSIDRANFFVVSLP